MVGEYTMVSSGSMNASSLFASSFYGLQNAYQYALPSGATGVTQADLLSNKNGIYSMQSSPFSSYMATNFAQLDKDKDGKISAADMSSIMTTFSKQGMSYQQLMALSGSAGVNSQDLNNIMSNFSKIDKNGDGKVSQTEINYYMANKKINDKITELKSKKSSDFSICYSDDSKSDDAKPTSSITN